MKNIYARISDIQCLLKAETGLKPAEKASLIEELFHLERILSLWSEFGDVPMDPETECLEEDWHGFPKGTFRKDIWHWFESEFHVSVYELLYKGKHKTYTEAEMKEYGYTWKKMIPLDAKQAYRLTANYPTIIYKLYPDNTEAEISAREIKESGDYYIYGIVKNDVSK